MIKAVCFDLYETLITEWENGQRKKHNVKPLGIPEEIFQKEWKMRTDKRMDGSFPDYPSVIIDILQSLHKPIDEERIKIIEHERIMAKATPFEKIDEFILGTLRHLKELNLKIGLISNCAPEEVTAWETSKLVTFFDAVIFSYKEKCAKPHPPIYHTACQKLGVTPEESLFIGDGGSNELIGASKVGMQVYHATWFLPTKFVQERNMGFPQLKHPTEILDLVKTANSY